MATKYTREDYQDSAGGIRFAHDHEHDRPARQPQPRRRMNSLLWLCFPLLVGLYITGQMMAPMLESSTRPIVYGSGVITAKDTADGQVLLNITVNLDDGRTLQAEAATEDVGWKPGERVGIAYQVLGDDAKVKINELYRYIPEVTTDTAPDPAS